MSIQDLLKLAGVAIVVIGLALRLRTTLVVVVAAMVTGLAAGMPLFSHEGFFQHLPYLTKPGRQGIIDLLGRSFADNRLITLFIITLPAIGLSERYGLQRQAADLIRKIRAATVGRLQIVYQLFRILHGVMGIRLNGHPSFVRPMIFPMSLGAARPSGAAPRATASAPSDKERHVADPLATARGTEPTSSIESTLSAAPPAAAPGAELPSPVVEKIKAASAAAENYGNFYGQNLSPAQAGVLLVFGVMQGLGFTIGVWDLVKYTTPVVAASVLIAAVQFSWLDRDLSKVAEGER